MNPDLGDFLHNALDQVEHNSGVASFYHRFAAIKDLVAVAKHWLPESYFSIRFTYGLRPDYQLFVLRFQPTTVLAPYRLATIYEESLGLDFPLQSRELGSEHRDLHPQSTMRAELREFLHDALDRIEHNSSVEAFFHMFESIRKLVLNAKPWLTESYFASHFVYGLEKEYQIFILRFNPLIVAAAYRLALLYEESVYLQYFPELECPHADLQVENSVTEIYLVASSVDRASEVIVVEDFSSEFILIDSPADMYQS